MTKKITPRSTEIEINALNPAVYNPRKISEQEYSGLMASIKKFGLVEPLVVNKDYTVVGGHQRLKVCKDLGFEKVPCFMVDLDKKDEKKLNVVLNNPHIQGNYDKKLLLEILEDLKVDEDYEELQLDKLSPLDLETEEDNVPEPEKEISRLGDLWELNGHRLLCGDSTKEDHVKTLLNGAEPYLMITDPPYGVEYDADWRNRVQREDGSFVGGLAVGKVSNDDNADWTKAWELSPSKVAYVYHAGLYSAVVCKSLQNADFETRSQIIWAKTNFPISRGHYHWKHEPCWYAIKKGATAKWKGDRKQTTIWEIDKPQRSETGHSTQKPIECMAKPIKNHEGDVYDPFLGSGSTLIACEQLNRVCYGMELDPKYCDVVVQRWGQYMTKKNKPFEIKRNGEPFNM